LEDVLTSLINQLSKGWHPLPESIRSLYKSYEDKQLRPSIDRISRALQSVTALHSRAFIVIDALDECQSVHRANFLSEIFDLRAKTGVNIFATSRFIPQILKDFEGSLSLEIRANEGDVRSYLHGHLSRLPAFVARNLELREEIVTKIVKAVDGMYVLLILLSKDVRKTLMFTRFLLAQLHLDSLTGKRSPKAIRTALKQLATGSNAYDRAYDEAMNRIKSQATDAFELAQKTICWITLAHRPLTISQLQTALAIDEGNLSEIEDIVSVCAGLVTLDEDSNIIRFVHYTVQEYFERTGKHWLPEAQTDRKYLHHLYILIRSKKTGPKDINTRPYVNYTDLFCR
jgi:hypothetical protein